MSSDTSEKGFQKDFINYLTSTGYEKRTTNDYNAVSCLDVELVLKFIKTTQLKAWKKFARINKSNPEASFISSLMRKIAKKGTIDVLRKGFKDGAEFKLFYPMPYNSLNPELKAKFNQNIFSVIDELEYENKDNGNRLDLVIFINGIPISTIELKNTFSQGVENAMKQYKKDRDPREQLFKNCLVHFAMSNEKIYMATKLAGANTRFLPFNKGIENPEVEDNYKTSYLYTEILQKNQLSMLINNFIFKEDDIVIFPRFHQLDCVNTLLNNPQPGNNYLIQHSAGSGKTKTIAWLAHGLINKFDSNNNRIYDKIIVISDRKVIDTQLQDQVKTIEKKPGVVEKIDQNSRQLAEAIKSKTNIIVTTIHKFSYILDEIVNIKDRNYAIIVDEAHSSQTGSHAKHVREGLTNAEADDDVLDEASDEFDEELLKQMEKRRNTPNLSFFAFTATPKAKTLEMFGYKDPTFGDFRPHHLYSMKQAIEEGFILDVLENYLTYPTYFKLVKTAIDDPEFNEEKAKKVLRRFVELHPHAIAQKTSIILDHFMNSTRHKIEGKAKAMLVTSGRKEAVLYKLEFDRQIKSKQLPIKTLAAFTGTIKHDTIEYTEANINDIGNKSIKESFKDDDYKILIVANKFQTGFDEPLLQTMYVDKKLNGVAAVQTLSRLNRIAPHKNDTLVIDFANDTSVIQKAFEPYYGETTLEEETDYHKLYDLQENIYDFYIFDETEVEDFFKAYSKGVPQAKLHNLLSEIIKRFNRSDKEDQNEFKKKIRRYQSIYSFMSQLLPFSDLSLEKLYIYLKFLTKVLPTTNNPLPFNVLEDVDMDSYKIDTRDEGGSIVLGGGEGILKPMSPTDPGYKPEEQTRLSQILESLNEQFGTEFTEEDTLFISQMTSNMISNDDLMNKVHNNPKENVSAIFDKFFNRELVNIFQSNEIFYNKINNNEELRERLREDLLDFVYREKANAYE